MDRQPLVASGDPERCAQLFAVSQNINHMLVSSTCAYDLAVQACNGPGRGDTDVLPAAVRDITSLADKLVGFASQFCLALVGAGLGGGRTQASQAAQGRASRPSARPRAAVSLPRPGGTGQTMGGCNAADEADGASLAAGCRAAALGSSSGPIHH